MATPKPNTSDPGLGNNYTSRLASAPTPRTGKTEEGKASSSASSPQQRSNNTKDGQSFSSYVGSLSYSRRTALAPNINTLTNNAAYRPYLPSLSGYLQAAKSFKSASLANIKKGLDEKVQQRFRRAIRNHWVFSIHPGFPAIRKALIDRGWVEKLRGYTLTVTNLGASGSVALTDRLNNDETEREWMSRGLKDYSPDFYWIFLGDRVQWSSLGANQIINQFPNSPFTTKNGITSCLQNAHWFAEPGVASANFPRCYRLFLDEERAAFINDFRLTACIGLLKWVVGAYERDGDQGILESNPLGKASSLSVEFAIRQVNYYVRVRKHEDVDWLTPPAVTPEHWEIFLNQYYSVVLSKSKLAVTNPGETGKQIYDASKRAIRRLAPFWPQLNSDGTNNVWICKPGDKSRGMGIVLMSQLDRILNSFNPSMTNKRRDTNWVVQKYIERPLLIYKTKFDIRQWFLVTDWNPLTVWFYKESYLRFCSRPFTIDDYHESIHLTNNAVQIRYQNQYTRDKALPRENMWDNYTFQAYLKSINKLDLWERMIYPAMKQGVLCVLLASQENISTRKNCFELYGADYMLSEDFIPWLIEINSCPCMAPTTTVTARMCWQCLYDCIKVVIDRRDNPKAETGLFELIYKQNKSPLTPTFSKGMDAVLMGHKFGKETTDWPRLTAPPANNNNNKPPTSQSQGSLVPRPKMVKNNSKQDGLPVQPDKSRFNFTDLIQRLRMKDAYRPSPVTTTYGTTLGTTEPTTPAQTASTHRITVNPEVQNQKPLRKRNSFSGTSTILPNNSKMKPTTVEDLKKAIVNFDKQEGHHEETKEDKYVVEGKQVKGQTDDGGSNSSKPKRRRKHHQKGQQLSSLRRKKSASKKLTLNQISAIEAANFKVISLEPDANNAGGPKNETETPKVENASHQHSNSSTSSNSNSSKSSEKSVKKTS